MEKASVLQDAGHLNDGDAQGPPVTLALGSQSLTAPRPIVCAHPSTSHTVPCLGFWVSLSSARPQTLYSCCLFPARAQLCAWHLSRWWLVKALVLFC